MPEASFSSDFVQALTDEIERFTAALPPAATTYRRADLRHALQRALYFRFVNDERCQRGWWAERPGPGWLARLLRRTFRARVTSAALVFPRFAHTALQSRRLRRQRNATPRGRTGMLVFAVIHAKFVRYVQAIGLDHDATAFYCGMLDTLQVELARAGIDVTVAPAVSAWRRLFDARQPYLQQFGLQQELDAHLAFLDVSRPRAVVVVEGNSPSDEVINQACKLVGIPCACIQQGWSPIIHAAFRQFSFTTMFVWGEAFARLLATHSPRQRFVPTGSHVIGPAEPTSAARCNAISFFLQGKSPLIDDAVWSGFLELVRRVAARCPALPVLVREHPSCPLDQATRADLGSVANIELVDPARSSLHEQLARSRVGVSLFSTTLFECVASGVVPVAVNPNVLRQFVPSLAEAGVGVEAGSWADAEEAIIRLCEDDAFYARYVARQPAFADSFFHGATREQAKMMLRAELARLAAEEYS